MENEDRLYQLMERGIESLDNLTTNIGRLLDEPMVELEGSPSKCPHCNILNPTIMVSSTDATIGKIDEFVLVAMCESCKNEIFGIVPNWIINSDKQTAIDNLRQIIERKT